MNTTSRTTRRHVTAIVASTLLLSLTPGLVSTVSAAKGGNGSKSKTTTTNTTTTNTTTTTTTTTTVAPTTKTVALSPVVTDVVSDVERATSMAAVVAQIGADDMWAAGYTGEGVDVAVIDTGVAPIRELSDTHMFVGPDLSFEGSVDAVAGRDTYGHGTHIAGIIAGHTPEAHLLERRPGDYIGVAPDARIVAVKVADNTGAVDVSQVIAAIDWVVQNQHTNGLDIRVLNLSYNTTGTQSELLDPLSKAVENAWKHGIVVVVSAGNEGRSAHTVANPATNPYVIAVSSAWYDPKEPGWAIPSWAPSGDGVRNPDVVAPGVSIMSLRVPGSRIDIDHPEGRVAGDDRLFLGSGTSQSAAVVSGAAALLLDQRPGLTPDQVKGLLTSTATDFGEPAKFQGRGLIDLAAAMTRGAPATTQTWAPATGLGTLEASRGTDHVGIAPDLLIGEYAVTGAKWVPSTWVKASEAGTTWSGTDTWSGDRWPETDWTGSSWSGSTWSGSTWSGSTWSGSTWSGSTWSGSTWSGSTWSGSTWSGSTWSGSTWSGSTWSGSTWSGSTWSGSTWF
jgi:serine protease AprX